MKKGILLFFLLSMGLIADALKIMEELWFYLLPTEYGLHSVKLFY